MNSSTDQPSLETSPQKCWICRSLGTYSTHMNLWTHYQSAIVAIASSCFLFSFALCDCKSTTGLSSSHAGSDIVECLFSVSSRIYCRVETVSESCWLDGDDGRWSSAMIYNGSQRSLDPGSLVTEVPQQPQGGLTAQSHNCLHTLFMDLLKGQCHLVDINEHSYVLLPAGYIYLLQLLH